MRRRRALLFFAGLAACRDSTPPPAVLTLLPAAFRGGSVSGDRLCLSPGQAVEAEVWVHQASVTFTVRGNAEQGGSLEAQIGDDARADADASGEPMEVTFRLHPRGGNQTLRLRRPAAAPGEICLTQVALTQP